MSACTKHNGLCAFEPSDDRCDYCHCSWTKITALATKVFSKNSVGRQKQPIVVEDVHYLSGYGETRQGHLNNHLEAEERKEIAKEKALEKKAQSVLSNSE